MIVRVASRCLVSSWILGAGGCVGPLTIDFAPGVDAAIALDDGGIPSEPPPDGAVEGPPLPLPSPDAGPTPAPLDASAPPTLDAGAPPPSLAPPDARSHSIAAVEAFVLELARRHPERVRAETYGESRAGRPIYALRITDRVDVDEGEPAVLLNYAIHGDEIITVECALALLHTLVEEYATDPRVRGVVDAYDLFIVPVVSPDSFAARSREVEGVDPNREFPHPDDPTRRPIGVIDAAVRFFEAHDFVGTLDFHAFGELVLMPYGASFDRPPSWTALSDVAAELAAVAGYEPTQISHLFGAPAIGGSVDYYLWRGGGVHLAIEMATSKAPSTAEIPTLRAHATEMALRFVEAM